MGAAAARPRDDALTIDDPRDDAEPAPVDLCAIPSLWLATLLAALVWGRSRLFVTVVAAWAVLTFTFGVANVPPIVNAVWTFAHTVAAFVLVAIDRFRRRFQRWRA